MTGSYNVMSTQKTPRSTNALPGNVPASAELIAEARLHVKFWWPQLCRSARHMTEKDSGTFEEAKLVDGKEMLHCMHPALWKIMNCLAHLYTKIRTVDPAVKMSEWSVRYDPDEKGNMAIVAWCGTQSLRVKYPESGWIDYAMELKTLRTSRDTGDIPQELVEKAILMNSADRELLKGTMAFTTQLSLGTPVFAEFQDSDEKASDFSAAQP